IFDPHGDYTGLADMQGLKGRVRRYYAQFPVFEEDSEKVAEIVSTLGYELSPTMATVFPDIFQAAKTFYGDSDGRAERVAWLSRYLHNPRIDEYGIRPDMWLIAHIAEVAELLSRDNNQQADRQQLQEWGLESMTRYTPRDGGTLEGIKKRTYKAAATLRRMEQTSRKIAGNAEPLPTDRKELVQYNTVSVIALAGYTGEFQATIYSIIANDIFEARVREDLKLPALLLLEEAHNFAPAKANTS